MKSHKKVVEENEKYYKEKFRNSGHLPDKNTFEPTKLNPGEAHTNINKNF
ncbi:hypothetical protein [Clostridium ihumii]|nr:hypothetical protein [Clostridium ihumii]